MPVTYVDKSVQDMPVQVKGIYTTDENVLHYCGHLIENNKEQFFLIWERYPIFSMLHLFEKYQEWGIASIALPESVWVVFQPCCKKMDVPPTLEVFVCRGE